MGGFKYVLFAICSQFIRCTVLALALVAVVVNVVFVNVFAQVGAIRVRSCRNFLQKMIVS